MSSFKSNDFIVSSFLIFMSVMTFPSEMGLTPISKTIWFYYYCCYYYWSYFVACGILVLKPGIEPKPPAVEV